MTGAQKQMDFTEITLNSKHLFDHYLKKHDPKISELTFTNFFAWRYYYRFRYAVISDLLCVIAAPAKSKPFAMMPVGEVNERNFGRHMTRSGAILRRGAGRCFSRITRMSCLFEERLADEAPSCMTGQQRLPLQYERPGRTEG